jgi:hypothetical protein
MDTDGTAPEPASPHLAEEISALSARIAKIDHELANLMVQRRRRMGRAAYGIAAVGLSVLLFAVSSWVAVNIIAHAVFDPFDQSLWWGRFLTQQAVAATWLVVLCGTALAIIAGAVYFRLGWRSEQC